MNYEKEIFKHSNSEKTLAALSHSADIYKMQSCLCCLTLWVSNTQQDPESTHRERQRMREPTKGEEEDGD